MPSRIGSRRILAALAAPALVVVAGWEICTTVRGPTDVPGDAAWSAAAALVRAKHQPGDLIVFAPRWVDPVGRMHLGDLIPLEMAGRMDGKRYPRIWQLSIRQASAPETEGLAVVEHHAVDGITISRFEQPAITVVTDLTEVKPTVAEEGRAGTSTARVEIAEVAYEPRRCVLVSVPPGRAVRVMFPQVRLGTELVGSVGIADVFDRRDNRDPITVAVEIGGREVAKVDSPIDRWVPVAIPTKPGSTTVTFVVQWSARPGATSKAKQVCLAGEARR